MLETPKEKSYLYKEVPKILWGSRSDYQRQIVNILGQLPSTCFFSSIEKYLLTRVSVTDGREREELTT